MREASRQDADVRQGGIELKRKIFTVCLVAVFALILAGILFFFLQPQPLGNMGRSYEVPTMDRSTFSFSREAGERIRFVFMSDVKSGNLDIVLYDSQGTAVYKLDQAKRLSLPYTLDRADTYTLAAECTDFVGSFRIVVYPVK